MKGNAIVAFAILPKSRNRLKSGQQFGLRLIRANFLEFLPT